jgi:hypothetical protein
MSDCLLFTIRGNDTYLASDTDEIKSSLLITYLTTQGRTLPALQCNTQEAAFQNTVNNLEQWEAEFVVTR